MFTFNDISSRFETKFNKPFYEFTTREKAIVADSYFDNRRGRYSKFLMWGLSRIVEFFEFCKENNVEYFELSDPERWAFEDAFDMQD